MALLTSTVLPSRLWPVVSRTLVTVASSVKLTNANPLDRESGEKREGERINYFHVMVDYFLVSLLWFSCKRGMQFQTE